MMRCPNCGRVMTNEFNGSDVIATCYNEACYSMTTKRPSIIDNEATERFWDYVDERRIKNNPDWIHELNSLK